MSNLDTLRTLVSSALVTSSRQWRRTSHDVLATYGVSEACAMPLLFAGRLGDGTRQVALAEAVGIEGPSLVRLLDQLCRADLVRRETDPVDGRAKTIWLTETGRRLHAEVEAKLVELRGVVLAGITPADLEIALRVLLAFQNGPEAQANHIGEVRDAENPREAATEPATQPGSARGRVP